MVLSPNTTHVTFEPGVSLEATFLFLRGKCKVVYILHSSDPAFPFLLVRFTEYDDEANDIVVEWLGKNLVFLMIQVQLSLFPLFYAASR
ncbi:hypothetical protein Hanom_Chr17g01523881 [Helianthus anomalus]